MKSMSELDSVVLTVALPEHGLSPGDVGTIVHAYPDDAAWIVEFFTAGGDTIAVTTVEAGKLRPVTSRDILHARELTA